MVNPDETSRDYSSIWWNDAIGTKHARSMLDSEQAWSAGKNEIGEWMQIDLGNTRCVNGVVTQRRKNNVQRVTSYKLSYSGDGKTFTELPQVFDGNVKDDSSKVTNYFNAVHARYVRFVVQLWVDHVSMRAAVIAGPEGIVS